MYILCHQERVRVLTLEKGGRGGGWWSHFENSNQPMAVGMRRVGNWATGGENLELICTFEDKLSAGSSVAVKMSTE